MHRTTRNGSRRKSMYCCDRPQEASSKKAIHKVGSYFFFFFYWPHLIQNQHKIIQFIIHNAKVCVYVCVTRAFVVFFLFVYFEKNDLKKIVTHIYFKSYDIYTMHTHLLPHHHRRRCVSSKHLKITLNATIELKIGSSMNSYYLYNFHWGEMEKSEISFFIKMNSNKYPNKLKF